MGFNRNRDRDRDRDRDEYDDEEEVVHTSRRNWRNGPVCQYRIPLPLYSTLASV